MILLPTATIAVAYLLGSFSFAWLAGRICGVDLRTVGSGNLGATNAGRVLGGRWFAFVLVGDVLKGLGPVVACRLLPDPPGWLPVAVGAATILGHVLPCWHGFRGGKAVATSLGVAIALDPLVAGASGSVWALAWIGGRMLGRLRSNQAVGPASIIAALCLPLAVVFLREDPWRTDHLPISILFLIISALILVRHRRNLTQIFAGSRHPAIDPQPVAPSAGDPPPVDDQLSKTGDGPSAPDR
jgi:glycerol-3-phosphate acyltransferase PlsY